MNKNDKNLALFGAAQIGFTVKTRRAKQQQSPDDAKAAQDKAEAKRERRKAKRAR